MIKIKLIASIILVIIFIISSIFSIVLYQNYEKELKENIVYDANKENTNLILNVITKRYEKVFQSYYSGNNSSLETLLIDANQTKKNLSLSKLAFFNYQFADLNKSNNKNLNNYLDRSTLESLKNKGYVYFTTFKASILSIVTVINVQNQVGLEKPIYILVEKELSNYFLNRNYYLGYLLLILLANVILFIFVFQSSIRIADDLAAKQVEENISLVSAKKDAEEESTAKSKFLANISHELRTPLNSIIGFSDIIKNESKGMVSEDYKKHAQDINEAGKHLLALINDILDYSKADAGKLDVASEDIDLSKLIINCVRLVQKRAEDAGLTIVAERAKEHFIALADEKRLKQVILNIISNSIKNTDKGGLISIYTYKELENKLIYIEITDNGVGIAKKDLAKVMSSFGQIKNKVNAKHEGTGLGLPLSKLLVEMMGGTFTLESELGKGTTVKITIPESKNSYE